MVKLAAMSSTASNAPFVVTSPFGDVSLRVEPSTFFETIVDPQPQLPMGMSVDGLVLLRVPIPESVSPTTPLRLDVFAEFDGHPESGEWLDSVLYLPPGGRLQVGVHDDAWLAEKGIVAEVEYLQRGLRQVIRQAPADSALFVSVAWRAAAGEGDEDDLSTWFAVDLALPS